MASFLDKLKEKTAQDSIYGKIGNLHGIRDHKECLLKTREVVQELKGKKTLKICEVVLKGLSELFFKRHASRGAVRRLLSSYFNNNIPESAQICLSKMFHESISVLTNEHFEPETQCSDIRLSVDILASLLENFPFGEKCAISEVIPCTKYLVRAHTAFMEETGKATSPVDLNESMHNCLVTEQMLNRLIQKSFSALQEALCNGDDVQQVFGSLIKMNIDILHSDNILMECRCNAGITLTLMLRLCCKKDVGRLFCALIRDDASSVVIPEWLKSTGILNINKSILTTSSYLCFLYGSLSMLNSEHLLFNFDEDSFLLTELLLPEVLTLVSLVSNPASKVILVKLVTLWTEKAFLLSNENQNIPPSLNSKLMGGSDIVQNILDYVWISVDDSLDAVRQNARIAFDQILKTHLKLIQRCDSPSDTFNSKLIQDVLNIPWCKRGKYALLSCIVGNFGTARILNACPDLTACVIKQLQDHTLACYCSEFYEKMFTSHRLELPENDTSTWYKLWVNPVIEGLCTNSSSTKNHILQYLLPKLMSYSKDILQYMIQYLSDKDSQSEGTLGALIMCLRRGRSLGLLDDLKSDSKLWCGFVQVNVLKYALCSLDEQIRLDAYSLLCENKKTTKPIKLIEFELVKLFLPQNLNNQSPSFRQQVSAFTKKFFIRIRDSEGSLGRQVKKTIKEEDKIRLQNDQAQYKQFLVWLQNLLFANLHPGAAFAMRTSCLKMLSNMMQILESQPTNGCLFSFFSIFKSSHVYTLIECIADTFEENKTEALKILTWYNKTALQPILSETELKELFETCFKLSVSTRPQDSTASAFLARFLLQLPGIEIIIRNFKLDLKVLQRNSLHFEMTSTEPCVNHLQFLSLLALSLQDQTEVANKGLIIAAANRPIYPTILCTRYVLADVELSTCSKSKPWKDYLQKVIKSCLKVAELVSPVVQDSSPEGNIPAEAIRGPGLNFDAIVQTDNDKQMMLEAEKCEKTVTLMPEYLVVCCWRSIKEVSLFLGEISLKVSIEDESADNEGLLSLDQLLEIGDYFINQLLQSKHRGAFELAYAGFNMMCERLWKSKVAKLHQLPSTWLDKILAQIKVDDGNTGLCSTRRSAGIPFYVQALVATEPETNDQKCFRKAMQILLDLGVTETSPSPTNNPPRVHALNILKVLFKDNKLRDYVSIYISEGLMAAILGFKSKFWSVRNSSTLLLGSLITRIFGVKVSKDDNEISRKNCLTGRAFFQRFPKLYPFLLQEINEATLDSQESFHLHPSLYPVLMVLGRLFPSAMEGTDTNFNLAAFMPSIIRCSSSSVYKTRVMAARAIQPLVEKDRLGPVLADLMKQVPKERETKSNYNRIHGLLLQVKYLLDSVIDLNLAMRQETINMLARLFQEYEWLLSHHNKCPVVVGVTFEIFNKVIELHVDIVSKDIPCALEHNLKVHLQKFNCGQLTLLPGSSISQSIVAKLCVNNLLTCADNQMVNFSQYSIIMNLLSSDIYEVRLSALDKILMFLKNKDLGKFKDLPLLKLLLRMGLSDEWHFECLGKVFEVLRCIPNCVELINLAGYTAKEKEKPLLPKDVFLICLEKINSEPRDEIKCSILKFSSLFVGHMYSLDNTKECLVSWCEILKEHSSTEQDSDLQLAVAESILENVDILLIDQKQILNETMFGFWQILFEILQEDDLDVKEVAAKVLRKTDTSYRGDIQPSEALQQLFNVFVSFHLKTKPVKVVETLIGLILGKEEEEFEDERLFDKGEMNTYRDELHLLQILVPCVQKTLTHLLTTPHHGDSVIVDRDEQIMEIFDRTSITLLQRLRKCQIWSLSAPFKDISTQSNTITELYRSRVFLQCCDILPRLVRPQSNNTFTELKQRVAYLCENSCLNQCLNNILC